MVRLKFNLTNVKTQFLIKCVAVNSKSSINSAISNLKLSVTKFYSKIMNNSLSSSIKSSVNASSVYKFDNRDDITLVSNIPSSSEKSSSEIIIGNSILFSMESLDNLSNLCLSSYSLSKLSKSIVNWFSNQFSSSRISIVSFRFSLKQSVNSAISKYNLAKNKKRELFFGYSLSDKYN
jgi:hypothetical protein